MNSISPEELALSLAREDQKLIVGLINIRRSLGFSHKDVAERTGMTEDEVKTFEQVGHDPHMSTVRRYMRVLGVEVSHQITVLK